MGLSYRGVHSDDYKTKILMGIGRNIGPPTEHTTMNIPGYQGSYPVRHDDRGRVIPVRFAVLADDQAELRTLSHQIADWLRPVKDERNRPIPQEIIFDDDTGRRWMGYPIDQISAQEIVALAQCEVRFFCPKPYAYALAAKTTTQVGTNTGTEPAEPIITVTVGPEGNFFLDETFYISQLDQSFDHDLKVSLGDKHLLLLGTFGENDVIVFDKEKRMVTVNGADARQYLWYDRRWFDLPAGAFEITTDPDEGLIVEVEFTERWR